MGMAYVVEGRTSGRTPTTVPGSPRQEPVGDVRSRCLAAGAQQVLGRRRAAGAWPQVRGHSGVPQVCRRSSARLRHFARLWRLRRFLLLSERAVACGTLAAGAQRALGAPAALLAVIRWGWFLAA